jgi:CrcB protein
MWPIIFVALGGAIGAILRYGLSSFIAYKWISTFPSSTLIINVSGCLVVAYLMVKGFETGALATNWRLFLVVGIGGAFTTFSSFSYETVGLLREGFYLLAVCNAFGNLFLCILATIAGVILAKI